VLLFQIQAKVSNAYSILRLNFAASNDSDVSSSADRVAGGSAIFHLIVGRV